MESRSCLIHPVLKVLNQPCRAQGCCPLLGCGCPESAVCGHKVLLFAHTGPMWAIAQQFSSSLVPVGTYGSPGCFGCSQQPSLGEGHPCGCEPSGSSGGTGFSAHAPAVLGTRVRAEDPGLGKRWRSGLLGFSFSLFLLGWGSKSRAMSRVLLKSKGSSSKTWALFVTAPGTAPSNVRPSVSLCA